VNRFLTPRYLKGLNPWVLIFTGMALFHLWRESLQDIIIFGLAAILILSQVFGLTKVGFAKQPQIGVPVIAATVGIASVLLLIFPRHSAVDFLVLVAFVPIGVLLLMYQDQEHQRASTEPQRRARFYWALWASGFGLTEVVAYIFSKLSGDLYLYPTISSLMDPILDIPILRALFIALWLMSGVYLFGIRRKK
jgi:hypothetical protein